MRQLFPTDSKIPSMNPSSGSVFTEEQYEQLLSQIDELREELAADKIDLDTFKHNIEQAVTTITVTSENVRTNILNATTAVLTHLTATDITAPAANITRLIADAITGDTAAIRALTSTDATITNATISDLNATKATIEELHTTTFNPASVSTTDLTATNASITNETADKSTVNEATITNADIAKAKVVELKADKADILEAEIKQIYAEKLNVKYITHKEQYNRQEVTSASVSADGDYWIVLPKFLNGTFNIIAKSDTNEILWSMEVANSTRNIAFRWSVNDDYNFLKDVDLVLDEESYQEFIQIHANTNGLGTFLYYRADSYDTEITPTIYAIKKYETTDPLKHFDFNRAAGTWLPNSVFAGEFHADSMIIDETIFEKITLNHDFFLPTAYDQYGHPINYTKGTPGQYITPTVDEFDHTGIQWKDPIDNRTPSDVNETINLITEATLGNYTGEMTSERTETVVNDYASLVTDGTYYYKDGDNYVAIVSKSTETDRTEYAVNALTQDDADVLVAQGVYLFEDPDYVAITSIDVENKTINDTDYSADWETMSIYGHEVLRYYVNDTYLVTFPLTVYGSTSTEYNIKHLGDGTTVHGSIDVSEDADIEGNLTVEGDTRTKHIYDGETIPNDLPNDSLVIDDTDEKLYRKRDFVIEEQTVSKFDELAVKNSDYIDWADMNGKPVIYNKDRDALEPSDTLIIDNLEVDDLKVNNNLDVGNDVRIAGDLYVSGTTHTVTEETIESKSDTIVLREGNPNGLLPGQQSGIIINNYDGNESDLSIVSDETGTLRVGTGTGTSTVLTNVAYNSSTGKWYSFVIGPDDEKVYTEITPQPSGAITATTGKTEEAPYTVYDSVTFTVIDKTTLQPILTRDEEADMSDNGILVLDKDNVKAKTLPVPTVSGQVLTAEYDDVADKMGYQWNDPSASIFRFTTFTDYQTALEILPGNRGYIPDGSLIIIDGDHNYLRGPDGYVEP